MLIIKYCFRKCLFPLGMAPTICKVCSVHISMVKLVGTRKGTVRYNPSF